MEAVFLKHMKAVVTPLFQVYSVREQRENSRSRLMRFEDYFRLLDALGAFPQANTGEARCAQDAWDRVWIWQHSAMTHVDELSSTDHLTMRFVEFMEVLARLVGLQVARRSAPPAEDRPA